MSETLQCDSCRKLVIERSSIGWLELRHIGVSVVAQGEDPGPWHFDSLGCLHAWVSKQEERH